MNAYSSEWVYYDQHVQKAAENMANCANQRAQNCKRKDFPIAPVGVLEQPVAHVSCWAQNELDVNWLNWLQKTGCPSTACVPVLLGTLRVILKQLMKLILEEPDENMSGVSLCSPGCSGTHYVDHVGFELTEIHLPLTS
ncbi:hypothetical protein H671_3g10012 [Cricetulus griseus]|nr:hypothetical protein H671_3g10012 [Cricetulus griseus]